MGPILSPLLLTLLIAVVPFGISASEPRPVPGGTRLQLTHGDLFVPDGFRFAATGRVHIHLHGAAAVVEANFVRAQQPGVLVTLTLPGLSKVYQDFFSPPGKLNEILTETATALQRFGQTDHPPEITALALSSFSAGFGGVRELLKDDALLVRLDSLLMADSIYAGFTDLQRTIDPALMTGFEKFARAAAAGQKRFLLTHSQLETSGYASTAETAAYLIAALRGSTPGQEPSSPPTNCSQCRDLLTTRPGGLHLLSRFQRGNFEVLSFAGNTANDHMAHLRQMADFWPHLTHSSAAK